MLLLNSKHVRNKWSKVHYTWRLTTINNGSKLILLVAPRADSLGSVVDQRTNSQSRDWRLHYNNFPQSYPSTTCQYCSNFRAVFTYHENTKVFSKHARKSHFCQNMLTSSEWKGWGKVGDGAKGGGEITFLSSSWAMISFLRRWSSSRLGWGWNKDIP